MQILVEISIPHPPPRTESISLSDLNLTREEWDRMELYDRLMVISDYISNYDGEFWEVDSFTTT